MYVRYRRVGAGRGDFPAGAGEVGGGRRAGPGGGGAGSRCGGPPRPRPGCRAAKRGRGVASEVALARRDSPVRGGRHLGFAKALVYEMPHTLAALECGALSEWRATLIVRESACLDVEDRRSLMPRLCAEVRTGRQGRRPGRRRGQGDRLPARWQAVVDRAAKAEATAR